MDFSTNVCSYVLIYIAGAQLGWGRRERGKPSLPFFENQKQCPDFGKKCPDCVPPQVKFAIQNVDLRVSKIKTLNFFPVGSFFLDFLIKCLSNKCPNFTKPLLPRKIFGCAPAWHLHIPMKAVDKTAFIKKLLHRQIELKNYQ